MFWWCIENKHQKTCFLGEDLLPQGMTAYLTEEDIFLRHFHLIYTPSMLSLFGFSTFIRRQILRLSRLFWGNSLGTLSWTSNIQPTSYICTVCGIYKDSCNSWPFRQPFSNQKKKKGGGGETETSVSWFARGLDELCCRWPLRVIHGFTGRLTVGTDAAFFPSRGSDETHDAKKDDRKTQHLHS